MNEFYKSRPGEGFRAALAVRRKAAGTNLQHAGERTS